MKCPYCDSDVELGMETCPSCFADLASMEEAASADALVSEPVAEEPAAAIDTSQTVPLETFMEQNQGFTVTTVGASEPVAASAAVPVAAAAAAPIAAAAQQASTQYQAPAAQAAPSWQAQQAANYAAPQQQATPQYAQPYSQQQNPFGAQANPYAQNQAQGFGQAAGATGGVAKAANKTSKIIIAIVAAVVLALGATVGLAFAGIIDVPFISGAAGPGGSGKVDPNDPVAVYKDAMARLQKAENFDLDFSADLNMSVAAGKQSQNMDIDVAGDFSVSNYNPDDLGDFEATGNITGNIYGQKLDMDIDYSDGVMQYTMTKPSKQSGKEKVDPEDLLGNRDADDLQGMSEELLEDATIDGNVITLKLSGEDILDNPLFQEALKNMGGSFSGNIDMGEWVLTIEILDKNTGAMKVDITGDLNMKESGYTINAGLDMSYTVKPK